MHASRAPCDPQLPTRIRPQAFNFASPPCTLRIRPQAFDLAPFRCAIRPPDPDWNPASNARFSTLPVHPANPSSRLESCLERSILHTSRASSDPQSRLQSGIKCSIWHPSRAPCDPQLPTRIRPQASNFARLPRTLRPFDPDWNPASSARFGTLPVHPCGPQLLTRIRPQTLNFARIPRTLRPRIPTRIRLKRSIWHPPGHPATPSSRPESSLNRSFLHASRVPSDLQLPATIRPQTLNFARIPRTLRPPASD